MNNFFTRNEVDQFGEVVWADVLGQWNPKKTDVYHHVVAVMKGDTDSTYRAVVRHDWDAFELVSGERNLDDAIVTLHTTYS